MPFSWSLESSIAVLLLCGGIIAVLGVKLTRDAERIGEITGFGQAIMGAVFLGMITSLAGSITSVNAALNGAVELSVGNAVGGIAAQTTFLVFADLLYRKTNLEYAAASEENLFQIVLLILLLAIALLATFLPGYTFFSVDIFSVLLVATYIGGIYLVSESRHAPMWVPQEHGGEDDTPGTDRGDRAVEPVGRVWLRFLLNAATLSYTHLYTPKASAASI